MRTFLRNCYLRLCGYKPKEVGKRTRATAMGAMYQRGYEDGRAGGKAQVQLLANYIQANCPFEIFNAGAAEVAIKVMGRMADGVKWALFDLERLDAGNPPPQEKAIALLQEAYGLWGQGLDSREV